MYNSIYPVCARCKTEEGLSHMFWFCPKLFLECHIIRCFSKGV